VKGDCNLFWRECREKAVAIVYKTEQISRRGLKESEDGISFFSLLMNRRKDVELSRENGESV